MQHLDHRWFSVVPHLLTQVHEVLWIRTIQVDREPVRIHEDGAGETRARVSYSDQISHLHEITLKLRFNNMAHTTCPLTITFA